MADCYKNLSSVRDCIEGERNIQGFFLAYLNLNDYAAAPRVEALRQGTQMHKIIMQFVGWELLRMEEI